MMVAANNIPRVIPPICFSWVSLSFTAAGKAFCFLWHERVFQGSLIANKGEEMLTQPRYEQRNNSRVAWEKLAVANHLVHPSWEMSFVKSQSFFFYSLFS